MKLAITPRQLHFYGTIAILLGLGIIIKIFGMFSVGFFLYFAAVCIVPFLIIPRFVEVRRESDDSH